MLASTRSPARTALARAEYLHLRGREGHRLAWSRRARHEAVGDLAFEQVDAAALGGTDRELHALAQFWRAVSGEIDLVGDAQRVKPFATSASSMSLHGVLASNTSTTRSAQLEALARLPMPANSSGSVLACNPAVSDSSIGQPSMAVAAVTMSRVVPGVGWTIARSKPISALIRLLLPTFGRPASTTRHGSSSRQPSHERSMSVSISSPARVASPSAIASATWSSAARQRTAHWSQRMAATRLGGRLRERNARGGNDRVGGRALDPSLPGERLAALLDERSDDGRRPGLATMTVNFELLGLAATDDDLLAGGWLTGVGRLPRPKAMRPQARLATLRRLAGWKSTVTISIASGPATSTVATAARPSGVSLTTCVAGPCVTARPCRRHARRQRDAREREVGDELVPRGAIGGQDGGELGGGAAGQEDVRRSRLRSTDEPARESRPACPSTSRS